MTHCTGKHLSSSSVVVSNSSNVSSCYARYPHTHTTEIKTSSLMSTHLLCTCLILCSRQRYVLGDRAMHQMARSSVFLSGLGGLGVEIGE